MNRKRYISSLYSAIRGLVEQQQLRQFYSKLWKKFFTVTNLSGALWVNWLFLIWCRPFAGSSIYVTHILQYYKNQIYNTELV